MWTPIGIPRCVPAGTTETGNARDRVRHHVGPGQVRLEGLVARLAAVERRRRRGDRREDDVVGADELPHPRTECRPAAEQLEEAGRVDGEVLGHLEHEEHLVDVASACGRQVGAGARAAVGGHHPEEEVVRLLERGRDDLLDRGAGFLERGGGSADRLLGLAARGPDAVLRIEAHPKRRRRRQRGVGARAGHGHERIARRRGPAIVRRAGARRRRPSAPSARCRPCRACPCRASSASRRSPGRARGRAEPDDPVVVARHADRAAAVGAEARDRGVRGRSGRPRRRSSRRSCAPGRRRSASGPGARSRSRTTTRTRARPSSRRRRRRGAEPGDDRRVVLARRCPHGRASRSGTAARRRRSCP